MSAAVELLSAHLMMPADVAHRRLRQALADVERDYWALVDAVHEAHESEAWLQDDRAHEARYRAIMSDRGMGSVFRAYCFDEFGLSEGNVGKWDLAGRLRAGTVPYGTVEWSRLTMISVRPIGAAILNGYEPAVIAAALNTAGELAAGDAAKKPRAGHADHDSAPIRAGHVRKALEQHGLVPPLASSTAGDESKAEREERQLAQATERLTASGDLLLDADDPEPVIVAVIHFVRRLSDNPRALRRIREALG